MPSHLPEQAIRQRIDQQLDAAGWAIQDLKELNLSAEQQSRFDKAKQFISQSCSNPLPFTYETISIETNFRDQRNPDSRACLEAFRDKSLPEPSPNRLAA